LSIAIIEENEVFDNGPPNASYGQGHGIWIDECAGPNGPNIVRNNLVYDNVGFGIFVEKSSNTEVGYNIVVNNATTQYTSGIGMTSSGSFVVGNNSIYNNTIVGSNYWGYYCGVYDTGGVPKLSNNTFVNNIIVGSSQQEIWATDACVNDGYHGSGNVYAYNSLGNQSSDFIRWNGQVISTYNQWEAAYGQSTHSVQGNPQFADASQGHYWLAIDSPCNDTGLDLGSESAYGIQESSVWPERVRTANQYQHGSGWEVGAFVSTPPVYIDPPD